MQKIVPYLWFEKESEEAVDFYISLFDNSKVDRVMKYDEASAKVSGMPEGSVMTIDFTLAGQKFGVLNGGDMFKFSPAISFFVSCKTEEEIQELWDKLIEGGKELMPLMQYPFSEKYGWVEDRYGVSWQLNLADRDAKVSPSLMFVGKMNGKAKEAIDFYTDLFENSKVKQISKYEEGEEGETGTIKYAAFSLDGVEFTAMDSNGPHEFTTTGAISFLINCETQEEIDKFWNAFSDGGETMQCGWVTDRFGITWQVAPRILDELLADPDKAKARRVMIAMLEMEKMEIDKLEQAAGEN